MSKNNDGRQPPTVLVGLMAGAMLSAAFLAMMAAIIPQLLLVVLVAVGGAAFLALQYFAWARWLHPLVVKLEQQEKRTEADPINRNTTEQHEGP
ncbi:MAG: hypothetical protein RL215_969 [Planctomycetota bacterium]